MTTGVVVVGVVDGLVVGVVNGVEVGVVDGFVVGVVVGSAGPQDARSSKSTMKQLVTRNVIFAFIFPPFLFQFYSMYVTWSLPLMR